MMATLYIAQNAIGDIVAGLPSVAELSRITGSPVDICVKSSFADLFASNPYVGRLILAPTRLFDSSVPAIEPCTKLEGADLSFWEALQTQYDLIVDAMSIPQTAALVRYLQPHAATGIAFDGISHAYSHPVSLKRWRTWSEGDRNASDCFADVIRAWRGVGRIQWPRLYIAQRNGLRNKAVPKVALNPGAGSELKRWPLERFVEIGRLMASDGFRPLFVFGPKEMELYHLCADQIGNMGADEFVSTGDGSDIQELVSTLMQCDITVSNDCAVMHVSAAAGVPTLGIFGPSRSDVWRPPHSWCWVTEKDIECRKKCLTGCADRACLNGVSVDSVMKVIRRMHEAKLVSWAENSAS